MIKVTRLDQSQLYINADMVQSVESTPDTHIVLLNGHSYVVRETDEQIVDAIIRYRQTITGAAGYTTGMTPPAILHLVANAQEHD